MTKSSKSDQKHEKESRTSLYEIVGVEKDASQDEVKKAYRIRALQSHPDKDPSPEAKLNFQKLHAAYSILKNPESRKLYDETGFVEGEGFDKAADFFRTKFGRISEQDIEDFSSKYKGSDEEIKDLREYYEKHDGDVSDLLEWIPLSEPGDVDRFILILEDEFKDGKLTSKSSYKGSLQKLRKNAARMEKEQARFSKLNNPEANIGRLSLAIRERRQKVDASFLDDLVAKYAKPKKKKSRN